jgi:hypothetical protein
MKNEGDVSDSRCLNNSEESRVYVVNSKFERCKSDAIIASKSFIIFLSYFNEVEGYSIYLKGNSTFLIEALSFSNLQTSSFILWIDQSQGKVLDCPFSSLSSHSIHCVNAKEILLERFHSDGGNSPRIHLKSNIAKISDCEFKDRHFSAVYFAIF